MNAKEEEEEREQKQPRVNFRPLLFCAFGLALGIFAYGTARFGGFSPSELLLPVLLFVCALFPLSRKRLIALALCVLVFAGAGALALHLYTSRFLSAEAHGGSFSGTVRSVSVKRGYSVVILDDLYADGKELPGKCRIILSDVSLRAADILLVEGGLSPVSLENFNGDAFVRNDFARNIRYTASGKCVKTGVSRDPFLRLNAALYDCLHSNMGKDEADVGYALLTGDSGGMDEELSDTVRRGGVAHIFAVSGLHIGILYGAACLALRPLKKYGFLIALVPAFLYCAFCGFTTSSVRAVIMCAALALTRASGRKYDFLGAVSLAALPVLLFSPAQWYSAGLRLSFGACIGLALFSPYIKRFLLRLKAPRVLADALSANLSVQIFTLPVMMDCFGYLSVWGTLFNLLLLPVLPLLFLGLLACALLALIISPAASFFLLFPEGMLSAFLYFLEVADVSLVICGFSLGTGAAVFFIGCVLLSGRFRMRMRVRAVCGGVLALLFSLCVLFGNVVFTGCRIDVFSRRDGSAALIRSRRESVFVVDGTLSLGDAEDFLRRTYGGTLSAVVVLSEDILDGVNSSAFLKTRELVVREETETGLKNVPVRVAERFSVGDLSFRFESPQRLLVTAEGCTVELGFGCRPSLGADLFVGGGNLQFFLIDGTIFSVGAPSGA